MAEERMLNDEILLGIINAKSGGGGGGTSNYNDLSNKPQIGGTTLTGNKSLSDLGAQEKLTAGMYININSGTISVKRDVSEDVDEVLTLTHDTSGGTNKINAVLTVGGETIDSETITTSGGTFHDLVQISFNGQAVRFKFKYLVASKTQSAGYENYIYNEYTDTFVETIGEESKLIIKSELDTALSSKQDTLTFDDTPTDNSNNPVKSNGIYDALADKQDATDNSLETEAKTIVGAINEHEGDIGSLKSGLTTLDNEVNGDATTYPYADVITIPDAIPANLADCTVKIEPVQDLHGYDHPWVGGAGKNKLPLVLADIKTANTDGTWSGNVYTHNSVTFTVLTDSDDNVTGIKVNGTTSNYSRLELATISNASGKVLNGCPSGGSSSGYKIRVANTSDVGVGEDIGSGYTIPSDETYKISINVGTGTTVSNQMFYPMLRLATETDATFAPYTNYCPISGHTEVDVQRDGRNLLEFAESYSGAGGLATNLRFSNLLKPNTYVLSCKGTFASGGAIQFTFMCEDGSKPSITLGYDKVGDTYYSSRTFTKKIVGIDNIFSNNAGNSINDVQLELGSSATDYVPYAGKTYTIALGDTIYGCTVDFDSGVLSNYGDIADEDGFTWIDGGTSAGGLHYVDCNVSAVSFVGMSNMLPKEDSAWDKTYPCVNIYESRIRIYGNFTSLADFKEQYSGLQVYYQKATPTTIQLTPQQIQLLKGQNTLTASTGQISVTVNGVSGSIGAVQTQANATDAALAELVADIAEKLPTAPTTDGAYVLTVTVADGTPTYSWESAT